MVFASPETAAYAANIMSALCISFTILFLFWCITHLARRFFGGFSEEPKTAEAIAILGSGAVGALAYTFSDSFWFSATEGEVYALSSLFTAAVFWSILNGRNQLTNLAQLVVNFNSLFNGTFGVPIKSSCHPSHCFRLLLQKINSALAAPSYRSFINHSLGLVPE